MSRVVIGLKEWFSGPAHEKEEIMLNPRAITTVLVVVAGVVASLIILGPLNAQGEYKKEEIATIPWGEDPECLSTLWDVSSESPEWRGLIDPPGPFAVAREGEFVVAECNRQTEMLKKFDFDGCLVACVDLRSCGLHIPRHVAIAPTGEVLLDNYQWDREQGSVATLYLFDSSLQLLSNWRVPGGEVEVTSINPSDSTSFRVQYSVCTNCQDFDNPRFYEQYLVQFSLDASVSEPELVFSRSEDEPRRLDRFRFDTSSGEFIPWLEDMYGYIYGIILEEEPGLWYKFSPDGELVYTFDYRSDPGWERFIAGSPWFVAWSGDVYILHATDEGAVLTKYTLVIE